MTMTLSIIVCLSATLWLLWVLRRDRCSLGLPLAYLFALLFIHAPCAIAHVVGSDVLQHSDLTENSMVFTSIGTLCYVGGVYFMVRRSPIRVPAYAAPDREGFWSFCLIGGWLLSYGAISLQQI